MRHEGRWIWESPVYIGEALRLFVGDLTTVTGGYEVSIP